jgi:hypothetical protein
MFGGERNNNDFSNDLIVFFQNFEKISGLHFFYDFVIPSTKFIPKERSCHSSIVINNKLFIYGGKTKNNEILHDLVYFSFEKQKWKTVDGY